MPPRLSALFAWEKAPASGDVLETEQQKSDRIWVMFVLFAVSLFASSLPTISKRVSYLRLPKIVFFIGKHFGTGVILSTAFVHLLQDSFRNLDDPAVRAHWNIGNWTGLIVLGSLLSIFVVEYLSTSYVDRLQSYSSPSSSPPVSRSTSRLPSLRETPVLGEEGPQPETAPLLQSNHHDSIPYGTTSYHSSLGTPSTPKTDEPGFFSGHHRFEDRSSHASHSIRAPGRRRSIVAITTEHGDIFRTNSKPQEQLVHHAHHHSHHHEHENDNTHVRHAHLDMENWDPDQDDDVSSNLAGEAEVKIGHRRQVVGILMLQVGIMMHSLVIGLTLAIASGPKFASLITAIIFHQLFEGLSLGIRIAALPTSKEGSFILPSQIMKPVLAFMFAITTPVGIALGLALFSSGQHGRADLKLTQGLMSAISAGMLIYAACVEMLAGDFVMDQALWRSSLGRQFLALFSLFLGVAAMAVIGMYD